MNKSEYIKAVRDSQKLVASGKYNACTCVNLICPWHGKCFECVMIHRVQGRHVPECLQHILRGKIAELARTAELEVLEGKPSKEMRSVLKKLKPKARTRASRRGSTP